MSVAPPSYNEATKASSVNDYLSTRQGTTAPVSAEQQQERAQNTLEYTLDLATYKSPPPFPSPANAWLARDVDHEDWNAFLAQLAIDNEEEEEKKKRSNTDDDAEARQREIKTRREKVVQDWNRRFFAKRGCRIDLTDIMPQQQAASGGEGSGREKKTFEGLGFTLGDKFVGLSMPPDGKGAGIRLGGMLLGVAFSAGTQQQDKNPK